MYAANSQDSPARWKRVPTEDRHELMIRVIGSESHNALGNELSSRPGVVLQLIESLRHPSAVMQTHERFAWALEATVGTELHRELLAGLARLLGVEPGRVLYDTPTPQNNLFKLWTSLPEIEKDAMIVSAMGGNDRAISLISTAFLLTPPMPVPDRRHYAWPMLDWAVEGLDHLHYRHDRIRRFLRAMGRPV